MPWETLLGFDLNQQNAAAQGQEQQLVAQRQQEAMIAAYGQAAQSQLSQQQAPYQGAGGAFAQTYNQNPWGDFGGVVTTHRAASLPPRQQSSDFLALLNEFNLAFQYGIKEITVTKPVYATLLAHFSQEMMLHDHPDIYSQTSLKLATCGGYMVIKREGAPESMNWDKYMEEVENEEIP